MDAHKSIVLVTVDCLRADHVGFMGYSRPTSPFLDQLAAESFVIPNAIAAGAPTYYSLPAIMASRYPLALGRDVVGLAPDEPSLASVLKLHGYKTAAFSAANPYISGRFGFASGFDTFDDFLQADRSSLADPSPIPRSPKWASRANQRLRRVRRFSDSVAALYDEFYFRYCQWRMPIPESLDDLRRFPSADEVVDRASEWLASISGGPFFLWLHLMDPHSPYYPKPEALALMGNSPVLPAQARYFNSCWNRSDLRPSRLKRYREEVVRLHDAGIRWADMQIQRLIAALQKSKRWDNCIFALTADHGEEFLDHNGRYHPPSGLMEEIIHVPLLLRVPGVPKKSVSQSPFGLIHLAPTLLEIAQIPTPEEFRGRCSWQQIQNSSPFHGPAISESVANCTNPLRLEHRIGPRVLAVRESRFKLLFRLDQPVEHLYDLEADPQERTPLSLAVHRAVRRRLLEIGHEHLQKSRELRNQHLRVRACLRDFRLEWDTSTTRPYSAA